MISDLHIANTDVSNVQVNKDLLTDVTLYKMCIVASCNWTIANISIPEQPCDDTCKKGQKNSFCLKIWALKNTHIQTAFACTSCERQLP